MGKTYRNYGNFSRMDDEDVEHPYRKYADGLNLDVSDRKETHGYRAEGCRGRKGKKKFKKFRTASKRMRTKRIDFE